MFTWLATAAAAVVLPLALVLLVIAVPATSAAGTFLAGGPSVVAISDIPPGYLALYMGAARTCLGLRGGCWPGSARSKATTAGPLPPVFTLARTSPEPKAPCNS